MMRSFLCFLLTVALLAVIGDFNGRGRGDVRPETYIRVDQFGYRPQDAKIAVIADPEVGFNSEASFSPGAIYEVRDANSNRTVDSGAIAPWMGGQIHSQSGDRAWWFDFSAVTEPGSYYIFDPETGARSVQFDIAGDVYRNVLIAATRTFFYQRSGFPKRPPHADPRWTDRAAFLGPGQDTEARFVNDKDNPELARDVRGGWFDAGDTNKYVTFATPVVHQLLDAYSQNPQIWTDDFNIPESGNQVPDLIDELEFELDWLRRMQDDDGGVFIKVGTIDHDYADRPGLDRRPRFYAPKCSSASVSVAGMFAHAALVFREFPALQSDAEDLQKRAIAAWNWFRSHPRNTDCDSQEIKSGDADRTEREQKGDAVVSAIYLFALTGDERYAGSIRENLAETRPFQDDTWSRYNPHEGDALLFYTRLSNGDETLKKTIRDRFSEMVANNHQSYGLNPSLDPYRAYMNDPQYHWGSNSIQANYGNTNYDVLLYNIEAPKNYKTRALDHLHYLHGVNPIGRVYLSNMYEYGAEKSANEIYHEWFGGGIYDHALTSPSGPAPGYLTGGPNRNYTGEAKPPAGEPPMKAYFDENDPWQKAWEITEPAIYYQSSYIKLLSHFVGSERP